MQADMDRYTGARSLQALLDALPAGAPAVAAAASAAPAATAPAFDAQAALLALVADRTGYPEDMIGLDADLEADLGIDSIKRVEIVGAFAKQAPSTVADAMQADMDRYTGARSLQALLAALPESAPAVAAAAPTATAPEVSFDAETALLALVADRTGYPAEMIGMDADLEADLGIDSIKRVEIVSGFAKEAPAAIANVMQADMERFTQAKTLRAVLDAIASSDTLATPAASQEATPEAAVTPSADGGRGSELPVRYVVRPREIQPIQTRVALRGSVLVLGEGEDSLNAQALMAVISEAGLTPVCVDADDEPAIRAAVTGVDGPLAGVILLHGMQAVNAADWGQQQQSGRRAVMAAFSALKAVTEINTSARLVVTSRLGGTLGRDVVSSGSAIAGGVVGLLNCARFEYPDAHLCAVDLNGQSPESAARMLLDELASAETLPEVGYVGDARYTSTTVVEPLQDTPFAPRLTSDSDWVVLATGGARGITASISAMMVRPGMTFVVVGRSARPEPESAELAGLQDDKALKKYLLEQARAQGETPKPAAIDRALSRVLADREIRNAIDAMESAGATVDYRAVDARDADAVRELVESVYSRYGRIDAVIHGAGVIEDKLLVDKTAESFERVFSTKVDGAVALAASVRPESLKLMVFFTSVAGRYGNRGQGDYAAANEALNRMAWQLSRAWPDTRVVSLNWGPWDAGMATEAVKKSFRERGIIPIQLQGGCEYFLQEVAYGPRHEVEVVVGEGPWQQMESGQDAATTARDADTPPMIRGDLQIGAGGALQLEQAFGVDIDPWLLDHQLDGEPVLPAAAAAEWMAQMAEAGWPGWEVAELQDVRALSGVRLIAHAAKTLRLRARASSHSDAGGQIVKLEIMDPADKGRLCYRASARIVERLERATPQAVAALSGTAVEIDATAAYDQFLFHGNRFQLLQGALRISADGIDATVRPSTPEQFGLGGGAWLLDPGLLDVIPQLAIVWSRTQHDTTALPSRLGVVHRYAGGDLSQPLTIRWRARQGSTADHVHYDAWVLDANERTVLAVEDAEGTASRSLNRLAGA